MVSGPVLYFRSFKNASKALHEVWRGWWIAYVTAYIGSLHGIYGERLPTLFKLNTCFGLWILWAILLGILCLMSYSWYVFIFIVHKGGRIENEPSEGRLRADMISGARPNFENEARLRAGQSSQVKIDK